VGYGRLAQRLLTQHRFGEAYAAAQAAVESDPFDEFAIGVLVDAGRAVGAYGAADSALARLSATSFTSLLRTGVNENGDGRSALRGLRSACARLDEVAQPLDTRAWCLAQVAALEHDLNGPEGAERLLRRALALHPGDRGALEGLADLAYSQGDWRSAQRLYERILTPAHPDLYLRLAEIARARGRWTEARDYEDRFVGLAARDGAEALNGLELALFYARDRSQCEDARALVEKELDRRRSTEALEGAAWIERSCGTASEVLSLLNEVETLDVLSPSGSLLKGLVMGEPGAALVADALRRPTLLDPVALVTVREEGLAG
jgi:tetratricopeptide (TPR) repeat protein